MPKRAAAEQYDSDGGFVEDAPKSKKSKGSNGKKVVSAEMNKDDEGNEYWDISGKRRLTISSFKKTTMISIREYYLDKDSDTMRPGKKGISLAVDQFNSLVELLPQVESVLKQKGIAIPRPQYKTPREAATQDEDEEDDDAEDAKDEEEEPMRKPSQSKSKLDKFKLKANHEATSDEDEG